MSLKLNPSHADRWIRCAGSANEVLKYPVKPAVYKTDGLAAHAVLEGCVSNRFNNAGVYLNQKIHSKHESILISPKIIDSVDQALGYILRTSDSSTVTYAEVRVNPEKSLGAGLGGAIDVLLLHPQPNGSFNVEIIDYKAGFTPVDIVDNWQLILYAWGVRDLYPSLEINSFKLTIIQPNNSLKGLSVVSSVTMKVAELLHTHSVIMNAVTQARSNNPEFTPGDKQCHWCPAKGGCPAFINSAVGSSGISSDMVNVAQQAVDKDPKTVSNEVLRELFEATPMIKKMLEAVEAEIMRRFEDGQQVDGMKIVKGVGRKTWAFDNDEMAIKLNKMGIPKDMVYEHNLISFNKACDLKWKKRNDDVVSLSKRQIETLTNEYLKKGEGKNTVVLESDPRTAVDVSAVHLFVPVAAELPDWI